MIRNLFLIIFLFAGNATFSQSSSSGCVTNISALTDSIACGESLFLQQVGVGGGSSDDFSSIYISSNPADRILQKKTYCRCLQCVSRLSKIF